jgi:putative endonuclease
MAWVNIIESEKNGRYYLGSTQDLENRLREHNNGEVASTKYLRPLRLIFSQQFKSVSIARRVEYKLKKYKSRRILEKVIADGKILIR